MSSYSFLMEVAGINPHRSRFADVLYEAGCDDALVVVRGDKLLLDFDREAVSYESAVQSATRAVESAGGQVVRVEASDN